jgi:hypothetical protein
VTLLADLVVLAHLAFIAFAAFGGLLARGWRRAPWLHLPAVAWGAFIEITGGVCPLTPLENRLRRAGGQAGYGGDFVERYLLAILYPEGLTPAIQILLAVLLIAINVGVYAFVWRTRSRTKTVPG